MLGDDTTGLAFMSAEKESGDLALEVTVLFVPAPIMSISATPAVIVRMISQAKPTILYDDETASLATRSARAHGPVFRSQWGATDVRQVIVASLTARQSRSKNSTPSRLSVLPE